MRGSFVVFFPGGKQTKKHLQGIMKNRFKFIVTETRVFGPRKKVVDLRFRDIIPENFRENSEGW